MDTKEKEHQPSRMVEFLRKKDFRLEKELGRGACGQTVLLYDDQIDEYFVCKKYLPIETDLRQALFDNFVREVKLLHLVNHYNVVRIFNYYLYPDKHAGYILMEYVKGKDIERYLMDSPEHINEIFAQVVEGFAHLEKSAILHRDIRPANILVTEEGAVKIIDFGFGKRTAGGDAFGKSITLNWWCEPPQEFAEGKYDYSTEVYFVGKLFDRIIAENGVMSFKHWSLLSRMCATSPSSRIDNFADIRAELLAEKFVETDFSPKEIEAYRDFSRAMFSSLTKIEQSAKYYDDVSEVQTKLETCYKQVMLEEYVAHAPRLLRCFVSGQYYFHRDRNIAVSALKEFLTLFQTAPREKKNIILGNIHARLDAVPRYTEEFEDDIPF